MPPKPKASLKSSRSSRKGSSRKDRIDSVRTPVVAGLFYPSERESLRDLVDHLLGNPKKREKPVGALVPHGPYRLSGQVMGETFSRLKGFSKVIILGPNHSGSGKPVSFAGRGQWETPLGRFPVDGPMATSLRARVPELEEDLSVHQSEHAAEIQLPFLQRLKTPRRFLPLAFNEAVDLETVRGIGRGLAEAVSGDKEDLLLLVSANLSRYEGKEAADRSDPRAMEAIFRLDEERLLSGVRAGEVSMCGAAATAAFLVAARELGASGGRLIKYQTCALQAEGETTVNGYAGILFD